MILLKRIYEKAEKNDGYRILVDRLWPRGVSRENAKIDLWLKEVAPSDSLRKWFNHDVDKWSEFKKKYREELKKNNSFFEELQAYQKKHKVITLLYGAKDTSHNQAIILQELLEKES